MLTDGHIKHHMTRTGYAPHIWKPWNDNKPILRVVTSAPEEAVDWFICNHDETGEITAIARNKEAAHKLAALLRTTAARLEKEASDDDG
jgi:hypothetical protein